MDDDKSIDDKIFAIEATLSDERAMAINDIYSRNRKLAASHSTFTDIITTSSDQDPLHQTFQSIIQKNNEIHSKIKHLIRNHIVAQKQVAYRKAQRAQQKYLALYQQWNQKPRQSLTHPLKRRHMQSDIVHSEADLEKLINLSTQKDRFAVIPDMLPQRERLAAKSFKSTNGFISNPLDQQQKFNSMVDCLWSKGDRILFRQKLGEYGKDFYRISSFFATKTTQDCIFYFYMAKYKCGFKKFIKRCERKRISTQLKDEAVIQSTQRATILKKRSNMLDEVADISFGESSASDDNNESINNEEIVSKEAQLTGKDLNLALNPAPEEVVVPVIVPAKGKQALEQWTPDEKIIFIKTLEEQGLDYTLLAKATMKPIISCKSFYIRYRRGLKLDQVSIIPSLKSCLETRQLDKEVDNVIKVFTDKKKGGNSQTKKRGRKKTDKEEEIAPAVPQTSVEDEDDVTKRTVSYWSVSEKNLFLKYLTKYGRNWELIAKKIGTKSVIQNRNYYHNYKGKLDLENIMRNAGHVINENDDSGIDDDLVIENDEIIKESMEEEIPKLPISHSLSAPAHQKDVHYKSQSFTNQQHPMAHSVPLVFPPPSFQSYTPYQQQPKSKKQKTTNIHSTLVAPHPPHVSHSIQHPHQQMHPQQMHHPHQMHPHPIHQQMYPSAYYQPPRDYQPFYRPPFYPYGMGYGYGGMGNLQPNTGRGGAFNGPPSQQHHMAHSQIQHHSVVSPNIGTNNNGVPEAGQLVPIMTTVDTSAPIEAVRRGSTSGETLNGQ